VCSGADLAPPVLLEAKFARRDLIFLRFNEPLNTSTAQNASNYSADQGVGAAVSASLESAAVVVIGCSGPLESGVLYTVSVTGVEDALGNAVVLGQEAASFRTPEVSITEIMYDNRGVDVEWIELHNTTDRMIDLSGWYISDDNVYPASGEGSVTLPPGTDLQPNGYQIVNVWNDDLFGNWRMPGVRVADSVVGTPGALANGGDNVALYDSSSGGTLIDGSLSANLPDLSTDGESVEKIDELFPWGDEDTIGYNIRKCVTPIGFDTARNESLEHLSDFATPGRANGSEQNTPINMWKMY
jgi:hypothetical protein